MLKAMERDLKGAPCLTAPAPPNVSPMVRISISQAAFDALAAMVSLGSVGYELEVNERGERLVWLQTSVVDRLMAMREPSESYSDVILRLIEVEVSIRR